MRTTLLQTGLFDAIEVSIQEDQASDAALVISLDEKWSVIPLPIFGVTSNGWIAGLGIIDANAFGLADQALVYATLQSTGWNAFFRYECEPPDDRSFGWSLATAISSVEARVVDIDKATLIAYDSFSMDSDIEVKRAFGPVFSVVSSIGFSERAVSGDEAEAGRAVPLAIGVSARKSSWDGVFLSEKSLTADVGYSFPLIGDGFAYADWRVALDETIAPGFRSTVHAGVFSAPNAPLVFQAGPSAANVSILPSGYRAPSLAGFSFGFESRILSVKSATISALASYQVATSRGGPAGDMFAHGPAFGVRLYLAKIAIPAIDVGAAYNAATGIWQGAFGLGVRM